MCYLPAIMKLALSTILLAMLASCGGGELAEQTRTPNVVLIITDDQGYGDVGAHGNSMIRTPNLDRLHAESVRLTDFHVDPTCAPTRSALMTGRYSSRTGVWHTIMGRSIIHRDETTLAQALSDAGYATGHFGKWHLGDNWPYRPEDRGFGTVVRHGGGGVQQTPDYWGNDYFDDTYWKNGVPTKYEGYCTDVFFDEALSFIGDSRAEPFFAYIATNAPHGPYLVEERYSKPYTDAGVPDPMDKFYGMIENIDDNVGRLVAKLDELGLSEDTILIFMTDNGTAAGVSNLEPAGAAWRGFNAGMRGRKGSEYDGGTRVPFFVRWPNGDLGEPRDVDALTAHIDVLPTVLDLVGAETPAGLDLDGTSLSPLLRGKGAWPERTLTVHSQRIDQPEKWRKSVVMTEQWRLINGQELYDIQADPSQGREVSADHPQIVADLRAHYDVWWERVSERFEDDVPLILGADEENPARITAHDWHPSPPDDASVPWNQIKIQQNPLTNGYWDVEVEQAGVYELTLYQHDQPAEYPLDAVEARATIGVVEATASVEPGSASVTLVLSLPAGRARMQTWLKTKSGEERGAFFVYVKRI